MQLVNIPILAKVPAVNGVHFITNPFNIKEVFITQDIHKNNPTLLYYGTDNKNI